MIITYDIIISIKNKFNSQKFQRSLPETLLVLDLFVHIFP